MNEIVAIIEYENNVQVPTVGIQGLGADQVRISEIVDVDASNLENGSVLVYSTATSKWVATRNLEEQYMNAGHF